MRVRSKTITTITHFKKDYCYQGFTLIELLITLSIMGIAMAFAVPNLMNVFKETEAKNVEHSLTSFLIESRNNAIIYQKAITLCIADHDNICQYTGGTRLLSFIDENDNHVFDQATDNLLLQNDVNVHYGHLVMDLALDKNYLEVRANGRTFNLLGNIKYCPFDGPSERMFKVSFNRTAQIKIKKNRDEATNCNG